MPPILKTSFWLLSFSVALSLVSLWELLEESRSIDWDNKFLAKSYQKVHETSTCLSFDEDVDRRIAEAKQVFITMPAKAAGSSLKKFADKCTNFHYLDNFIISPPHILAFLSKSRDLPSIIVSHIPDHKALVRLAETSPRDVLTIFVYREESERKVSAIKHVVESCFCHDSCWPRVNITDYGVSVQKNETACVIYNERRLIHNVIKKNKWEIGFDTNNILSCPLHEAIDDNAPNMIMTNYKQADRLQKVLAKHHCPDLMSEVPTRINFSKDKTVNAFVHTEDDGDVPLTEWVESKRVFFDWALQEQSDDKTCKSRTRQLENNMFSCDDEAISLGGV